MVPIGTLSHEYGHIAVAKFFGYETILSYKSMKYHNSPRMNSWKEFHKAYGYDIRDGKPFPGQTEYKKLKKDLLRERFLVKIGGPAQTMLTGTFSLLLLTASRKSRWNENLKLIEWFMVFFSLLWLRQPFNLAMVTGYRIIFSKREFGGDEHYISKYLELPYWSISFITGIIGALICSYVMFIVLPKKYRIGFTAATIIGGLSGYFLWMYSVGPAIFL